MYLIFELHCICAKELKMYFIIFDIVLNVLNILIALYLCAGTAIRHCDEHKGWLSPNLFNARL